jgi:hypothetical protein
VSGDVRDAIARAGGLFTLADLARRWGISIARVGQLAAHPDFPEPIVTGDGDPRGKRLYVGEEAEAFRAAPRGNPRRRNT